MIEFALRSTREEAQTYAITSDTTSPAPDGFPILWAVTWRARAAAWMLDHRVGFVDKMIEFALRSTREEAQTYAITSDTTSPAPDGFPILWAVTWRARAAAWMLDHRSEIERSIS